MGEIERLSPETVSETTYHLFLLGTGQETPPGQRVAKGPCAVLYPHSIFTGQCPGAGLKCVGSGQPGHTKELHRQTVVRFQKGRSRLKEWAGTGGRMRLDCWGVTGM